MSNWLRKPFKDWTSQTTRRLLVGLVVTLMLGLGVWAFCNWLVTGPNVDESRSTTARNWGLLIGGVIAIPLALWRSIVAHRQAQTAQRGLMNERYQKGAEMLGSDILSVRLGGIYALQGLAEEEPDQYHVQIMRLLCAFVRHPAKDERVDEKQEKTLLEDIMAIVEMIRTRSEANIVFEKEHNLPGLDLSDAKLRRSVFYRADLSEANLFNTDLSEANLDDANLSGAYLAGATLSGATLENANVSGTRFFYGGIGSAKGLIQTQLDQACADANNPPDLHDCFDANTGKPLVWNGKPL